MQTADALVLCEDEPALNAGPGQPLIVGHRLRARPVDLGHGVDDESGLAESGRYKETAETAIDEDLRPRLEVQHAGRPRRLLPARRSLSPRQPAARRPSSGRS